MDEPARRKRASHWLLRAYMVFVVVLRAGTRSLTLELAREPSDPTHYWVYWPGFPRIGQNPVGRLRTHHLDALPSGSR